jgi:indole-3-glycerol phosphate synthase
VIAVNARDLNTLGVDMGAQRELIASACMSDALVVAASGIKTRADVQAAAEAGAEAVLVGETLMRAEFPEDVLEELTGVGKTPVSG